MSRTGVDRDTFVLQEEAEHRTEGHILPGCSHMRYPEQVHPQGHVQTGGCPGLAGGRAVTAKVDGASTWGDENVLEPERGDSCTTV